MIKQVQRLPLCLEPRESQRSFCLEALWRSRPGGAGTGRAAWDGDCATKLPAGSAPRPQPQVSRQAALPRPTPCPHPQHRLCAWKGNGGAGGERGASSSVTCKPAPFSQAAHPGLRGHFPWAWKAPGPFLSGSGSSGRLL